MDDSIISKDTWQGLLCGWLIGFCVGALVLAISDWADLQNFGGMTSFGVVYNCQPE